MSSVTNAAITATSTKDRNTRFGVKPTYSFQANGQWFSTGFKNHGLNKGDVATFEYTTGTYGHEVNPTTIVKGTSAPAVAAPATNVAKPVYTAPLSSGKGVFPIPALDGQRAIVRQNALTNARELWVGLYSTHGKAKDQPIADGEKVCLQIADSIIRIARKFEAYACGDVDLEEVQAELDEMKEAA
jgi:hypothetical protein